MSIYLLDINVLVALMWTNHEHHDVASAWYRTHQRNGWATCPLTEAGFVRISSNPRIFPHAPVPAKAMELLRVNTTVPAHRFWKDDIPLAQAIAPFGMRFNGHQQTTDAYLFGLAIYKRGILATFDAGLTGLVEENSVHLKSLAILKL